jgi:hypothetical protein
VQPNQNLLDGSVLAGVKVVACVAREGDELDAPQLNAVGSGFGWPVVAACGGG